MNLQMDFDTRNNDFDTRRNDDKKLKKDVSPEEQFKLNFYEDVREIRENGDYYIPPEDTPFKIFRYRENALRTERKREERDKDAIYSLKKLTALDVIKWRYWPRYEFNYRRYPNIADMAQKLYPRPDEPKIENGRLGKIELNNEQKVPNQSNNNIKKDDIKQSIENLKSDDKKLEIKNDIKFFNYKKLVFDFPEKIDNQPPVMDLESELDVDNNDPVEELSTMPDNTDDTSTSTDNYIYDLLDDLLPMSGDPVEKDSGYEIEIDNTIKIDIDKRVMDELKIPINVLKKYLNRYQDLRQKGHIPASEDLRDPLKLSQNYIKNREIVANAMIKKFGENPEEINILAYLIDLSIIKSDGTYRTARAAIRHAYPDLWDNIRDALPKSFERDMHKKNMALSGLEIDPRNRKIKAREQRLDQLVIQKIKDELSEDYQLIIDLIAKTGARVGEIESMKLKLQGKNRDHILLSRKIEKQRGKYREISQKITKSDDLWNTVSELLCFQQNVNSIRKLSYDITLLNNYPKNTIENKFYQARKKVGADPDLYHLHALRHDFASDLRQKGIKRAEIAEKLGHAKEQNASRYGVRAAI